MHCPALQKLSPLHKAPQAPQLLSSELRSKHPLSHSLVPEAQSCEQAPAEQTSPSPHATVHSPQCSGSLATRTQLSSHRTADSGHWQAPSRQRLPISQALSHPPQCSSLDSRCTQARSHSESPGLHPARHSPEEHTSSASHALSQVPQWKGSEAMFTHSPSHSCCVGAHARGAGGSSPGAPPGELDPSEPLKELRPPQPALWGISIENDRKRRKSRGKRITLAR